MSRHTTVAMSSQIGLSKSASVAMGPPRSAARPVRIASAIGAVAAPRLVTVGDWARIELIRIPKLLPVPAALQPPFVWTPTICPLASWMRPDPELPPSVSMSL